MEPKRELAVGRALDSITARLYVATTQVVCLRGHTIGKKGRLALIRRLGVFPSLAQAFYGRMEPALYRAHWHL